MANTKLSKKTRNIDEFVRSTGGEPGDYIVTYSFKYSSGDVTRPYWMAFKVQQIIGIGEYGEVYHASEGGEVTEILSEAEVLMEGSVKWDGCSDFHVGDVHFCGGGEDAASFGRVFAEVHRIASEHFDPVWFDGLEEADG